MMRKYSVISKLILLLAMGPVFAQTSVEKNLTLDGQISPNGSVVTLSWFSAEPPRAGSATVKRRLYGQIGGDQLQTIDSALGPVMRFSDKTTRSGRTYPQNAQYHPLPNTYRIEPQSTLTE